MSHTPGPWAVSKDEFDNVIVQQGSAEVDKGFRARVIWTIATLTNGRPGRDEAHANARLIAAAPDLLEALELAIPLLEGLNAKCTNDTAFIGRIRAAIRKAKGE